MSESSGNNNGLVDRVQVEVPVLSGHSYHGSVPLWHSAVPRPDEGVLETRGANDESWAFSGVNEPRPDVEAVLAEPVCWRSLMSSAPCFSTKSSNLYKNSNGNQ